MRITEDDCCLLSDPLTKMKTGVLDAELNIIPIMRYPAFSGNLLGEAAALHLSAPVSGGPSVDRRLPRMRGSSYHSQSAAYDPELSVRAPIGSRQCRT